MVFWLGFLYNKQKVADAIIFLAWMGTMRVLVVDDCRAIRLIVLKSLVRAGLKGFSYEEADNGQAALESARRSRPDLVVSDLNMPIMNGLELLNAIREEGIETKVGFVTSEDDPETEAMVMGAGALFLVAKPFTPKDLRAALSPHFELADVEEGR